MCRDCGSEWKLRGLAKRDFQHSKDGPEEITRHPKRRNKRWCKGKEGREHRWEQRERWRYTYENPDGTKYDRVSYNWVCAGCGKTEWSQPKPPIPKHDHCYCITKISQRWKREEIYEQCCICGGKGKSYSFYRER